MVWGQPAAAGAWANATEEEEEKHGEFECKLEDYLIIKSHPRAQQWPSNLQFLTDAGGSL